MAQVIPSRMTAEVEGDFVVFLIGMRINKPWKVHKWLPVFLAMPRMLKELDVYSGMPPFGLGKVGKLVPAGGQRESARGRFLRARSPESAGANRSGEPASP